MTAKSLQVFLFCLCWVFLSSCAKKVQFTQQEFVPQTFNMMSYQQKVDTFMVVMDASESMGNSFSGMKKIDIAKDVVARLNQTIPAITPESGLRTFGFGDCMSDQSHSLLYGLAKYSRASLDKALETVNCTGGNSPLAGGIDAASEDLKQAGKKKAVIFVTDGMDMENAPLVAAGEMKARYGEDLCIYSVQVGDSIEGADLLKKIADIGECGYAVRAEEIYGAEDMAGFAEDVFLAKIMDSDGDGVGDASDICPGTPRGIQVNNYGCPPDTDRDGLIDHDETTRYKTDPVNWDTDGDGLGDGEEVNRYKTNPLNTDTDGGTALDGHEVLVALTNPLDAKDDVKELLCKFLNVNFEFDSDVVKFIYFEDIEKIVGFMKEFPDLILNIEGHTDNVGEVGYNLDLSLRRAINVASIISKKYGINQDRISGKGYGESKPIATNDTEEGRARNRRIEAKVCTE